MSGLSILRQILAFLVYVGMQVFFVRNLVLFGHSFCFVYIGFLLMLPLEIGTVPLLLIAFGTGLVTDIFYDTLGIHAAACVLLAFLRPYVIKLLTPRGGYDQNESPGISDQNQQWYVSYAAILILCHHLLLFLLQSFNSNLMFPAILKAFLSTFFTFAVLYLLQYMFYKKTSLK